MPASSSLSTCAEILQEIEDSRGSLTLKYLMASQILSGKPFEKGRNPYQDFALLISLRNDILHLKPRASSSAGISTIPKYIIGLQQRGLAMASSANMPISWFDSLHTREMAEWSVASAREIILAILSSISDGQDPMLDHIKSTFQHPPV